MVVVLVVNKKNTVLLRVFIRKRNKIYPSKQSNYVVQHLFM